MPERLNLRRATPADAAAVRALTLAAYAKWVPLVGREPRPMTADYDRAVVEHMVDLWEADGELLALIEMNAEPDHLLIVNIAVRPDQQGTGLGDQLLHHAETIAREKGFTETRLYTNSKFASNLAFYAKRGYQEYAQEEFAPGAIAIHMRKPLTS